MVWQYVLVLGCTSTYSTYYVQSAGFVTCHSYDLCCVSRLRFGVRNVRPVNLRTVINGDHGVCMGTGDKKQSNATLHT